MTLPSRVVHPKALDTEPPATVDAVTASWREGTTVEAGTDDRSVAIDWAGRGTAIVAGGPFPGGGTAPVRLAPQEAHVVDPMRLTRPHLRHLYGIRITLRKVLVVLVSQLSTYS